jgi:subtilisin family serine protease
MTKSLLTISFLLAVGAQGLLAQNIATRNAVRATYDLDGISKEIKEYTTRAELSKIRAYAIAEKDSLPIKGINERGNYFELDHIDENGVLFYKTTLNAGSGITARAINIPVGVSSNKFLQGEGMLVGVVDGLPMLDTHQEFYKSSSDRRSRVTLMEGVPSIPVSGKDRVAYERSRNHATHVGGTIASGGYFNAASKGLAPKASLWIYSWDNDIAKRSDMASSGILVSNHSYGFDFFDDKGYLNKPELVNYFGSYIEASRDFDKLTVAYPYYQPVVAAGNDGDFHYNVYANTGKENCNCDMLNGTGVSKNVVVVAAVEQVTNYTGPESVKIAYFSSQGPTNDFRIKPDISAKGVRVYSSGYVNPLFGNGPISNTEYKYSNGTSMAAPAVTAVFALWQEWAINYSNKGNALKSASIRALMAHTADEAGVAPGPDHIYGWGVINAQAGVDVMLGAKDGRSAEIIESVLNDRQTYTREINVTKQMDKMVVTLSWTDPEGIVSNMNMNENVMRGSSMLMNDLDVVVKKGKKVYYPWKLNKDFNDLRAIKGDNDTDNIEKIEIIDVEPGKYVIEVSHKRNLTKPMRRQEFSLISTVGEFDNLQKMEEVADIQEIKLWPNPVVNRLNVTVGNKYNGTDVRLRIFDINGRLVGNAVLATNNGEVSLDVSSYNANVYIVEVKTNDSSKTMRIVKK